MNLKRSLGTVFLGLIAIGLLVAIIAGFAVSPSAVSQATGKSCEGKIEAKQYNPPNKVEEPKNCPLKLVAKDFPLNAPTTVDWVIKTDPGASVVMTGTISIGNDGEGDTGELSRLENGDYKVYWTEAGCT